FYPAGVVGRVPEVFLAVGGELGLASRDDIPHPEVVVADESGAFAIGREGFGASTGAARCGRLQPRHLAWIERPAAAIGLRTAGDSSCARRIDENELTPTIHHDSIAKAV